MTTYQEIGNRVINFRLIAFSPRLFLCLVAVEYSTYLLMRKVQLDCLIFGETFVL